MLKFKALLTLKEKQYLVLFAILSIQFLICHWLWDKRWINPDEGAHIMDGRLVLDGLIPKIDYESRQILYVYILALFLKVFGIGYLNARFLPLISTIGVSLLVFLISMKLFNQKVALLAAGIYTFSPLSILESTIVKTEPLTTLLSCVGIYFVVSGIKNEKRAAAFFFLSGFFFSLAYYVRESSLAILLAVFLLFAITYRREIGRFFKCYGFVLSGYIFVCLVISALYSRFMTPSQIWHSPINPLHIVLLSLRNIVSFVPRMGVTSSFEFSAESQPLNLTVSYLRLTLLTNLFLFAGFLFSICVLAYSFLNRRNSNDFKEILLPFSVVYSWLFSLAISYAYWALNRGFFIQYFEEFLPPLSILLAYSIIYSLGELKLERHLVKGLSAMSLCVLMVFFFNRFSEFELRTVTYFLITALILSFFYYLPHLKLNRWLYGFAVLSIILVVILSPIYTASHFIKVFLPYLILAVLMFLLVFTTFLKRDFKRGLSFISFSFLIFSFLLAFAVSGRYMGLHFDCVWSPQTVKETSNYIKENSKENDEIVSGAVIWELESNRKPFMNQSHPLAYESGVSDEQLQDINRHLSNRPPRFIVLDGYTEQTYLSHVNKLQKVMDENYRLVRVVNGSRYPVKIYELQVSNLGKG